jgi:uncharacterized protein (TIGR02145 family)
MRRLSLLLILSILFLVSSCSKTGTFTDPRDGQTYKTVKIGNQTWFAQNLNYKTNDSWWYNNDEANGKVYGRLYTWDAAKTACPKGWHLPSDDEWNQLQNYLSENGYSCDGVVGHVGIAKSLATNSGWKSSDVRGGVGNSDFPEYRNKTGFSALPGGGLEAYGSFHDLGYIGYWWSSTEHLGTHAWCRVLVNDNVRLRRDFTIKEDGFSVRCLKD